MSLVITSSSQQEYDATSKKQNGLEKPSSFQNFLRSPLIVEKDSEVALVSLKCSRDTDAIVIGEEEGEGLFFYWGYENSKNMADGTDGSELPHKSDDINTPVRIELVEGRYTRASFATHLQERLEEVLMLAYREIGSITVSQKYDSNNVFVGYNIQLVQVGDGSGFTDKPSPTEFGAFIDKDTYYRLDSDDQFEEDDQVTDNFVASASGTDTLITGYNAGATGAICDVIGKAHPLSQVNSECVIYFNGSSGASVDDDGYTLGLVRSQGRTSDGVETDYGGVGCYGAVLDFNNYDDDVNIPELYQDEGGEDTPPFFWDVAFNWAPGQDGQVIHFVNEADDDSPDPRMKTVTMQTTPTNASLQAKYWDRVIFEVTGEKIDVKLGLSGSTATTTLVSSASTTFGERIKPIGQTCNQLYPKIAIHQNDANGSAGTAWLETYNGHEEEAYYDNNFWGYTDYLSQDEPWEEYTDLANAIDSSTIYKDNTKVDGTAYTYKGELTSNKGIANKYVIITGGYVDSDGTEYFWNSDQYETITSSGRLQEIIGLDDVMTQTDFGVSADDGADITFTSPYLPEFNVVESMFVRLKNMGINTFNANKSSISNIIYSCPKFDAQGNTGGLLFYEPSERVYVKLNNADKIIVNSLDIDIVNVNEQEIDSLQGNTLCVLHFRKAK